MSNRSFLSPRKPSAVRLVDVHPDGAAHRVSWGVLNLAHRLSQENPQPAAPGQYEQVRIQLDDCGYRFLPGHRLRLSVSTSYWPMVVPPPVAVTAVLETGGPTYLELPARTSGDSVTVHQPIDPSPLPDWPMHSPPAHRRLVERDLQTGLTHYRVYDDTGCQEIRPHGMRSRHTHEECYSIHRDDPLSYRATSTYVSELSREDWNTRTVSESRLSVDEEHFHIEASVSAWEGDDLVHQRRWKQSIPRDHC